MWFARFGATGQGYHDHARFGDANMSTVFVSSVHSPFRYQSYIPEQACARDPLKPRCYSFEIVGGTAARATCWNPWGFWYAPLDDARVPTEDTFAELGGINAKAICMPIEHG